MSFFISSVSYTLNKVPHVIVPVTNWAQALYEDLMKNNYQDDITQGSVGNCMIRPGMGDSVPVS